jgi:hypothetical protein
VRFATLFLEIVVAASAFAAAACGGAPGTPSDVIEPGTFIAFASDFRGFHDWESFAVGTDPVANSVHLAGPRTVYLNKRPPSGSKEFPVGTIIVKEVLTPDLVTRDVIARVKRGGTYNADGAPGWEWFELTNTPDGGVLIVWRGIGPPVGGCSYLGTVGGGCNLCHGAADDNDSVLAAPLHLSNF